jgi:hypothetical protein
MANNPVLKMLVNRTERIHCPGVGRNSRQGDPANNTALSSTCGTDNGKQPCHRLTPQMTFPPFSIHPGRGCPRNQNQPKAPAGTPASRSGIHLAHFERCHERAVPRFMHQCQPTQNTSPGGDPRRNSLHRNALRIGFGFHGQWMAPCFMSIRLAPTRPGMSQSATRIWAVSGLPENFSAKFAFLRNCSSHPMDTDYPSEGGWGSSSLAAPIIWLHQHVTTSRREA